MIISSEGIVNGVILDKYGKRESDKRFGMPTRSLPIKIENEPKGTKSFAVIFDDPDSVPVCGFVWVHWLTVPNRSSRCPAALRQQPTSPSRE